MPKYSLSLCDSDYHQPVSPRLLIVAGIVLSLLLPNQVFAPHLGCTKCTSIAASLNTISYTNNATGLPASLDFEVSVTTGLSCETCSCSGLPQPSLTVRFYCNGTELHAEQRSYSYNSDCSPSTTLDVITVTLPELGKKFPDRYSFEYQTGCKQEAACGLTLSNDGPFFSSLSGIRFSGVATTVTKGDLAPLYEICQLVLPIPPGDVEVFKSSSTLYTISEVSPLGKNNKVKWSESVNAQVRLPTPSELLIVEAPDKSYVEVHCSAGAGVPGGWLLTVGQKGTHVDPTFSRTTNDGEVVQFSVRVGDHDKHDTLPIMFRSYWWDAMSCCLQEDQIEHAFTVEPMTAVFDQGEPLMPDCQRRRNGDMEVRLPNCAGEGGNKTDWFISWPTPSGQVIPEGHAAGWKCETAGGEVKLISPAPGSVKYRFGNP